MSMTSLSHTELTLNMLNFWGRTNIYLHVISFLPAETARTVYTIPLDDMLFILTYRQTSDVSRTIVGNKTVGHSDIVGVSPVGAALTTSSYST